MCKHVAAVLYGVGARLDHQPELLFRLRGVDEKELIVSAGRALPLSKQAPDGGRVLAGDDLGDIFGLDMAEDSTDAPVAVPVPVKKTVVKKPPARKAAAEKLPAKKVPSRKAAGPTVKTPKVIVGKTAATKTTKAAKKKRAPAKASRKK